MTSVLVDTNIFIDVFGPETPFKIWSSQIILALKPQAQFIMTPVVWSELAGLLPESGPSGQVRPPTTYGVAARPAAPMVATADQ